jgi:uncharacterized protein (TIGR03435 family)
MRTFRAVLFAVVAALLGAVGHGQSPTASKPDRPVFEIASIKLAPPELAMQGIVIPHLEPGGRYAATNAPFMMFLDAAFGSSYRRDQIVGTPEWFVTTRFDLVAKAGNAAAADMAVFRAEAPAMMRALLEDRFNLRSHTELRRSPVYALVKSKADGSLGAQLRRASRTCPLPGAPVEMPADPATEGCRFRLPVPGAIEGSGQQMQAIAALLTRLIDRPVLDRTGVSGTFDLTLQWDPSTTPGPGTIAAQGPTGLPSFFTAIQDQLGLKLEPTMAEVEFLVIDHVDLPTPD